MTPVLLRNSIREMNNFLPNLKSEEQEYFARLHDLASLCLKEFGFEDA